MKRKYRMYIELDGKRFAVADYPLFERLEEIINRIKMGLDKHLLTPIPNEQTYAFKN